MLSPATSRHSLGCYVFVRQVVLKLYTYEAKHSFLATLDIIFAETMIKQTMQEGMTGTLYKVLLQTEQDTFWCISNPIATTL